MVDRFVHGSPSTAHCKLIKNRAHEAKSTTPSCPWCAEKPRQFRVLLSDLSAGPGQKVESKSRIKRQHMVCAKVMEWLRTPLTIFRQAAWVETCCYAPKVWYFQSRARSTSYCLTVNSFEIFSLISTFCPTVAEDSYFCVVNDFKVSRMFKDVPRCSAFSLIISFLSNCSLSLVFFFFSNSRLRFVSTPVASRTLAGHYCIYRDCCSHLYKPWLVALISWVVYCIDVFLP